MRLSLLNNERFERATIYKSAVGSSKIDWLSCMLFDFKNEWEKTEFSREPNQFCWHFVLKMAKSSIHGTFKWPLTMHMRKFLAPMQ